LAEEFRSTDKNITQSVEYIRSVTPRSPEIALVLGSGLGGFGELLSGKISISASDIPNYPISTVQGHAGKLLLGLLEKNGKKSKQLLIFQGRIHFYETNNLDMVIYPVKVAFELGIKTLILTNAAGGIGTHLLPGDLMLIKDCINLTGEYRVEERRQLRRSTVRFSEDLNRKVENLAIQNNIQCKKGVYCWTKGPSYETASEIQMMKKIGADAVGMSTVPEAIEASSRGLKVLGISCITNLATGLSPTKLRHEEVTEVANQAKKNFEKLLTEIIFSL
jgi:purine-nucleoside phosphorylase